MTKHTMALTYAPKVEPVRSGECRQTIRKGSRFAVSDEILIHGWADKPYRSKWSWRMRVAVKDVINILISAQSVTFIYGYVRLHYGWDDEPVYELAGFDFIDPPTGEALRDVLFGLNGAPNGPTAYQIVRW